MPSRQIGLKRVYETASADDGLRLLVERLWPRGLTKADAAIDHWVKDIAPTPELRTWYGHRPERWQEFRRRYRLELDKNQAAIISLRELCAGQRVTFIFAAKDVLRNGAVVLKEYIDVKGRCGLAIANR
jgi:DNA-3-methyladenine glycosylase